MNEKTTEAIDPCGSVVPLSSVFEWHVLSSPGMLVTTSKFLLPEDTDRILWTRDLRVTTPQVHSSWRSSIFLFPSTSPEEKSNRGPNALEITKSTYERRQIQHRGSADPCREKTFEWRPRSLLWHEAPQEIATKPFAKMLKMRYILPMIKIGFGVPQISTRVS